MTANLYEMVERMSVPALFDLHETVRQALLAPPADVMETRELRLCAGAIERELIARSQTVYRLQ